MKIHIAFGIFMLYMLLSAVYVGLMWCCGILSEYGKMTDNGYLVTAVYFFGFSSSIAYVLALVIPPMKAVIKSDLL